MRRSSAAATRRAAMLVGVVLLGVLTGWLLVSARSDDSPAAPGARGAGPGSAAAVPGSGDPGGVSSADGDDEPGGGSRTGASEDPDGPAGADEQDGAASGDSPKGGTVVEHRPADAEDTRPPQPGEKGFRLPGLGGDQRPAYLVEQAPENDRATGAVVAGYPAAYLRVPRRAAVVSSEVSSQGRRVQAVLQATCDCSVADVVAFHDRTLATLGLAGRPAPAAAAATSRGYRDRNDRLTLTVERDGAKVRYTLFSVLTAARG